MAWGPNHSNRRQVLWGIFQCIEKMENEEENKVKRSFTAFCFVIVHTLQKYPVTLRTYVLMYCFKQKVYRLLNLKSYQFGER